MGKIERLISIVMILLQKDIVSATAFSNLFNVSKRTILRDMEMLSLANIPIYSIHGVNGGYGIMDEYKLDKRLLSSNDIENILTALNGLEQILISEEVEVTVRKMESMVSSASRKDSIQLSFYDWDGRSEIVQLLRACQEAIVQGRLVSFDYVDRNGLKTDRTVEPYRLHFSETSWYLIGYCLTRMGYRTFKLSRTDNLHMELKTFVPRDDLAEQDADKSGESQLVVIKALIKPRIRDQFIERYGRKSVEAYNSELLLATIEVPQNHAGFQFLASFGVNLEIVEPATYVEQFKAFLNQVLDNYS